MLIMDYKTIITSVVNSLDPGLVIKVKIVSVAEISDGLFVVAHVFYPDRDMLIPFIIFNDHAVYMPYDWESVLPIIPDNIYTTKWVKFNFI